jgi:catechol 2,3-dioxygenase-like lactoylglutathione lyase family enzyme
MVSDTSAADEETSGDGGVGFSVVDVDHVAIRVSDLDRALGFYHDLLGLPVRDRERYDRGEVPYVAVAAGGRHVHLVPDEGFAGTGDDTQAEGEAAVGGEHLCLLLRSDEVDSRAEVEALLADLADAGVPVEPGEPRKRYGAYGRAWAAYVRDPDGRRVELKIH